MKGAAGVLVVLVLVGCSHVDRDNSTSSAFKDSIPARQADLTRAPITKLDNRLVIVGDFNGDGKQDTLRESYISTLTNKEMPKALDSIDYMRNMDLTVKAQPETRILSSIPGVDVFTVTDNFQQSGIGWFSNLGDLNDDGADEFGYLVNWADMSNLNTYVIMTIRKKRVEELFAFPVNETMIFDQDDLIDGQYLLKKVGPKTIRYRFRSDSATIETGTHRF